MDLKELVKLALDELTWIDGLDGRGSATYLASIVEERNQDHEITMLAASAIVRERFSFDVDSYFKELRPLFIAESLSDEEDENLPHLPRMPLGAALSVMAFIDEEQPGGKYSAHSSNGIRILVAALTTDFAVLKFLARDPCMLVRAVVALNYRLDEWCRIQLGEDPFFHVRRYSFFYNEEKRLEMDAEWAEVENGSLDADFDFCSPRDCNCLDKDSDNEIFEFFDSRNMIIPHVPGGLDNKLRYFGGLEWSTQPLLIFNDDLDGPFGLVQYFKSRNPDHYSITHVKRDKENYDMQLRMAIGNLALIFQTKWEASEMELLSPYQEDYVSESLQRWNNLAQWADEMVQISPRLFEKGFKMRDYLLVCSDFQKSETLELWVRSGTDWLKVDNIKSLSDASKIVNSSIYF